MATEMLHPAPRTGTVAREQFRAIGASLRWEWILFAAAIAFLTVVILMSEARNPRSTGFGIETDSFAPIKLLALLAPLLAWKHEPPSRRWYSWSMPVDRVRHTLLRVGLAWVWLLIVAAIYTTWLLLLASVTGGAIGMEVQMLPDPATGRMVLQSYPMQSWEWLVPLTGMAIFYLFGSAIAVGSDHPWALLAGGIIGFFALNVLLAATGLHELQDAVLEPLMNGRYGLFTALDGQLAVTETFRRDGEVQRFSRAVPDLQAWLVSVLLWIGAGVAALLVAVNRRKGA